MSRVPLRDSQDGRNAAKGASSRFEELEPLGRGGMAVVCVARDRETNQRIALKRLRPQPDETRMSKARTWLQREFHVLSQLAHPRAITVYDYGEDDEGIYYTMELLEGDDLSALAPLPWRQACAVIRDVCSVLALLHSRRLVHRDVSPRNVRVTPAGHAKLLDFGAMTSMGVSKEIVGTPAICAPEVVHGARLDARADLFSVGCTLYHALTGCHAYPARSFGQLSLLWGQLPSRPSRRIEDVPQSLDALVLSLLNVDADARPGSAAEVMERLSAIAELPRDESLPVPQAYLTTPRLVGRDALLERAQKKFVRAKARRRGTSLLLAGGAGVGRSRMLDAVLLDGRFRGWEVLRVDSADAQGGEGSVVRSLCDQALRQQPELSRATAAPHRSVLGHLVPGLVEDAPDTCLAEFDSPEERQRRFHRALFAWFGEMSRLHPLMIGVDDLDRIAVSDGFSCAFFALLANQVSSHRVLLAATADLAYSSPRDGDALTLHAAASEHLPLGSLQASDTEDLLRSIFGDTKHVERLATRIQTVAQGKPRDVMELARDLVDRGILRYEGGDWLLPAEIGAHQLPRSLGDALRRKLAEFDPDSLDLARTLALAPELQLAADVMRRLTEHGDQVRTIVSVDRLLQRGVLRPAGRALELGQGGWPEVLLQGADAVATQKSWSRMGGLFLDLGDPFRAAQCLLEARELDRALDVLVDFSRTSSEQTDRDPRAFAELLHRLPKDWDQTFAKCVELCHERGRAVEDLLTLNSRAAGIAAVRGGDSAPAIGLVRQLTEATGLDLYPGVDANLDPSRRMRLAMELAHAGRERLPERDRLPAPEVAVAALGQAYMKALGSMTIRLDPDLWRELPDITPLLSLSPAFSIPEMLGRGASCRITARTHRARTVYAELLSRCAQSEQSTQEDTHLRTMVIRVRVALAFLDASVGSRRALDVLAQLSHDPIFGVDALTIRLLYHQWQGQSTEAHRLRTELELDRIRNGTRGLTARSQLANEVSAFSAMDDLVQLKQVLPLLAKVAEEVPAWVPVEHYARGEYHRIRGSLGTAVNELELAAGLVVAGQHPLYCEIKGAYVHALVLAGRYIDACAHGECCMEEAHAAGLDHSICRLELPFALALARLEETQSARLMAERARAHLDAVDAGRLLRGLVEDTQARISMLAGDQAGFDEHRELCADHYLAGGDRLLVAKYERLLDDAAVLGIHVEGRTGPQALAPAGPVEGLSQVLSACETPRERAKCALSRMAAQVGARGASLFAVERDGPVLVAEQGVMPEAEQLEPWVRSTITRASGEGDVTETSDGAAGSVGVPPPPSVVTMVKDQALHVALVAHPECGRFLVTGLAVFSLPSDRPFIAPLQAALELSRYWLAAGEAMAAAPGSAWVTMEAGDG